MLKINRSLIDLKLSDPTSEDERTSSQWEHVGTGSSERCRRNTLGGKRSIQVKWHVLPSIAILKSADPCLPGGARPEAVSQNKQHRTNTRRACRRQLEVRIEPQSCKILFFYRFWTQRLTLKIIPTQVEKRCPWARQAMLFPRSGASLFGKAFGSEVVVLPGGANWAPKLYNPLFL